MNGTVEYVEFDSDILKNNPLSDPHKRKFPVYLPPNYDGQSPQGYPVVFGLAGFTGFGDTYLNKSLFKQPMDEVLDELINTGKMAPIIFVMPNCLTKYGGSQYLNSSAVGNYEDYIIKELVPLIDATFNTNKKRAVVGGSSGGYGSFRLAASHPDIFCAFADHCGDSAFEYCYLPDVPVFVLGMEKYDYDLKKFIEAIPTILPKDNQFHAMFNIIGMASCYSPNPEAEIGFDLPFDICTGEIKHDIWQKWLKHDPVHMIELYQDNLRKLKAIFVDAGKKDQFNLFLGARQVHEKLEKFGIDHVFDEHESDHSLLRREQKKKSLPFITKVLV